MKRLVTMTFLLLAYVVHAAGPLLVEGQNPAKPYAPTAAKASLRLPVTVAIGEEIPAALLIENTGTTAFQIETGGDYRSTGYPQRIKVRVFDAGNHLLPELPDEAYGGGGGGMSGGPVTVDPGKNRAVEFPLDCYVSFRKAGVYQMTAGHDLGWRVDKDHRHPIGEAFLAVTEPTEAQAAELVRKIYDGQPATLPRDNPEAFGRELDLEKKLCVMRHPAYLPALIERAKGGSKAAVMGIGHIVGSAATEALLALLDHPALDIVVAAAEQVRRRLPTRDGEPESTPAIFRATPYQIDPLLPDSWEPKFERPLIDAALRLLAHADLQVIEQAGYIVRERGGVEHAPAVLAVLQKSLDIYQPPRFGVGANTLDPPHPQSALIGALDAMRHRGWRCDGSGGTAQRVAWFRQLADKSVERPAGDAWQRSMLTWIENGPITLRTCALKAIPQPMTDEFVPPLLKALDDQDWGLMRVACEVAGASKRPVFAPALVRIIETVPDNFVLHAAHDAALACGAKDELWQALAGLIVNQQHTYYALIRLVTGTINLSPSGGSNSNGSFTLEQSFAIRDAWRDFLKQHQAALARGERIDLTDKKVIAALTGMNFLPDRPAVEIGLKGGGQWPPRKNKPTP